MTTAVKAIVRLKRGTGLTKDDSVNNFFFEATSADPAVYGPAIANGLKAFYNTVPATGVNPISWYLSNGLSILNALDIQMREVTLATGVLTAPKYNDVSNLGVRGSTNDLPFDCAGVLSFQASVTGVPETTSFPPVGPAGDTHPRARRRGRVYIGPLNILAKHTTLGLLNNDTFMEDLRKAASTLKSQTNAGGIPWSVYSRRDGALRGVATGWVDNAVDTQRRRDLKATVRTAWS